MKKDATLIQLEQEPLTPLLWRYSLPAVVGMTVMSLYNLIDAYFVGQWCGTYAIAALALVFPVMNLMIAVGTLVGLGSAATASIALGKQDKHHAFRVLGHSLIMSLLFGFGVGWGLFFGLEPLLLLFGAGGETLQPAYDFMMVMTLGFPISTTYMNLNHLMRASGYPRKAMYSLLLSIGSNIVLAPIFIYVLDWGMIGAGLATVAAQVIGISWVLLHYFNNKQVLHFRPGIYKLCGPIARRILTVGLPPCLVNVAGCVVVVCFNRALLEVEGPMGAGAYGIANRILFVFLMIVLGITQGMQPIVGYNLGMGAFKRVKGTLFRAIAAGCMVTTTGFLIVMFFPQEVISLFVKSGEADASHLVELGTEGIRLMAIMFPLVGAQVVIGNFFQAIGRPALSIFMTISRQIIFLIPCLYILPHYFGLKGIWLANSVADALAISVGLILMYLFLKRNLNKQDIHS